MTGIDAMICGSQTSWVPSFYRTLSERQWDFSWSL